MINKRGFVKLPNTHNAGIVVTLLCFFLSAPLFAQTKAFPDTRHRIEGILDFSCIMYEEPTVMKEQGIMSGIGASYTYRRGIVFKIEGRYGYGKVDYENSGKINDISDHLLEVRILGGYDYTISDQTTITPFIGYGYRYLIDDMAGMISSTGAKGYLRESNYYYIPIGIEATLFRNGRWSFGAVLEYDYFWKGVQKTRYSDIDSRYNNLSNHQKRGYGWRASVPVKRRFDRICFTAEPFIKYWNIEASDKQVITFSNVPVGYGWEPQNRSTEIGLKFGMEF